MGKKLVLLILVGFFSSYLFAAKNNSILFRNRGKLIVNYSTLGEFKNIGTPNYEYKINKKNMRELLSEVGDYIYPNTNVPDFMKNQAKQMVDAGLIRKNDIWSHLNTENPMADILAWLTVPDTLIAHESIQAEGLRMFFIGDILSGAGEYEMALKAYYSILIHFPRTHCWSADGSFVWYVGPASIDRINILIRNNPQWRIKLEDAYVQVENGNDINLQNDIITVNPGKFVTIDDSEYTDLSNLKIKRTKGSGKVKLVQYANNHWQMLVNDKPYIIRGITYEPTMVGTEGKVAGRSTKWMHLDENNNGKIDAPYDSWLDLNRNNKQDKNESNIGDFQLMKDMGVNTIRMYHSLSDSEYLKEEFNKDILRDLYNRYGIMVIMGDFLGAYGMGSGGGQTDYKNVVQREMMKECVRKMVLDHKDEPYILAWVLGNENDMPTTSGGVNYTNTNVRQYPDDYAKFVSEVIKMIHETDPNHPVMLGNMTMDLISYYKKYEPMMDIYGINLYMGKNGFGTTWQQIQRNIDVPVIITEYGCDSYYEQVGIDEEGQAEYHRGNWNDIEYNLGGNKGVGNSLGGIIFEWVDEWWKAGGDPNEQSFIPQSVLPFPDNWSHEEWFGVMGQGNGSNSPFLRQPKKVYYIYKDELWNSK